jgi:hemolysin D
MKFASNKIVALPAGRGERDAAERAFLPAALEVVETPPSPTGRAIAFTIIALFCCAIAWASLSSVDIIASATGKIIPSGRSKVIQPFETGVVRAIHVHDGQSVRAGQTLIELDPTMSRAELEHIRSDLIAARLDIARLQAALADPEDPLGHFTAPEGATAAQVAMEREFLQKQTDEHRAKLAALDRQHAQKEAERDTVAATINKLEAVIPVVQQRTDIRKALLHSEYGSRVQYLEMLQLLTEEQQELLVQKSHYREAEAAVAAIVQTRAQTAAEYQRTLYTDLAEAGRKAAGLADDVVRAEQRTKLQLLTAPIDGVVQQLAMHTVGGVVTPAQSLMVLVPTDSQLEIEAMVSNRDIGFVHPGQRAEIKIDTFNFTRYGLLHGTVLSVSRDSIVRDKPPGNPANTSPGGATASSEPKGQELLYAARISLDESVMQVENGTVNLEPGMAVTAEIKTGSRTVMSYLLSPLVRYREESLRER